MPHPIQILGLGYVGLPLAATLVQAGFPVRGVDTDADRLRALASGTLDLREPGLAPRIQAALREGSLRLADAPSTASVHILALPTPLASDHTADLSALHRAVQSLAPHLRPEDLVLIESTCPPGTAESVAKILDLPGLRVAAATERGLPGQMLAELQQLPRVAGGIDPQSTDAAVAFYRSWCRGPVHPTSARIAEITKLVENSYRDLNLAFANEIDMLCAAHGVPTEQVIALANHHPRVSILTPGPGVGGHCIPVDPWFLIQDSPEEGSLVRAARAVDFRRRDWVAQQVLTRAAPEARIACLGVSYKAEVGDVRNSAALQIATRLRDARPGRVRICDPWVELAFVEADVADVIAGSDLLVGLVPHAVFRDLPQTLLWGKERLDFAGVWWDLDHPGSLPQT